MSTGIDRPTVNKPLIGVAIVVAVGAFGGWYYWQRGNAPLLPAPAAVTEVTAPPPEGRIEHPVPAAPADASQTPLPTLRDSDSAFSDALNGAAAGAPLAQYWVPDSLIRHIVVTVDNLPRQKLAVDKRPLAPVAGAFAVDGDELRATLDRRNFLRYAPLMSVLEKADMQRCAAVYLRFYPLFQEAYQDLGYPNGYFNDRLVQAIDVLLATPQVTDPIELLRPNVMYVFADPAMEALPAGQKILIRMGPDNETAVKAKLLEFRTVITAAPHPR